MSEHTPKVRLVEWPPGEPATEPPFNTEILVNGFWVSLGVLGSTNFGGPGAEEQAHEYRRAVTQVAYLLVAAPDLLAALEMVAVRAYEVNSANGAADRDFCVRTLDLIERLAREAIRKTKADSQ